VFLEVRGNINQLNNVESFNRTFHDDVEATGEAALLGLRMLCPEPIRLGPIRFTTPNPFLNFYIPKTYRPLDHLDHAFLPQNYLITQDVANELCDIWNKATKAFRDDDLLLPISRFSEAYGRLKPEDMLIDYWIALEALFLPRDRISEMGQSMALAVSHYLGKTEHERRSTYEFVVSSHKMRSELVHARARHEYLDLQQKVKKTGDILRRSLRQRVSE
jgi:hypothetical protein